MSENAQKMLISFTIDVTEVVGLERFSMYDVMPSAGTGLESQYLQVTMVFRHTAPWTLERRNALRQRLWGRLRECEEEEKGDPQISQITQIKGTNT